MIDAIHAIIHLNENNTLGLDYRRWVDERTGELSRFRIGEWRGITIKQYDNGLTFLRGSWSKSANGNNYEDFTKTEAIEFTSEMTMDLPSLIKARISKLEYGLNYSFQGSPTPLDLAITHRGVQRADLSKGQYSSIGIAFPHSHYEVKLYNKEHPYNLSLQRIEIKAKRTSCISRPLVLGDLLKEEIYDLIGQRFLDQIKHIYFVEEDLLTHCRTNRQREILNLFYNPLSASLLRSTDRKKYQNLYTEFRRINRRYKHITYVKNEFLQKVENKLYQLLSS